MRQTPPPHRWIGFVLPLVAVGAYALILGYWATIRGVNQDEGFYIRAGVDVLQGQRLYADVFYPQMPYLPCGGRADPCWVRCWRSSCSPPAA
jgi:hypothetical protein